MTFPKHQTFLSFFFQPHSAYWGRRSECSFENNNGSSSTGWRRCCYSIGFIRRQEYFTEEQKEPISVEKLFSLFSLQALVRVWFTKWFRWRYTLLLLILSIKVSQWLSDASVWQSIWCTSLILVCHFLNIFSTFEAQYAGSKVRLRFHLDRRPNLLCLIVFNTVLYTICGNLKFLSKAPVVLKDLDTKGAKCKKWSPVKFILHSCFVWGFI